MAETKWLKTMSDNELPSPFMGAGTLGPPPIITSGDGTVFYASIGDFTAIARYKYDNNVWTHENFIGTPYYEVIGTKYLPNSTYTYPVATSFDGNTLVLIKAGNPYHARPRKILIVSYINGEFVQVGSEITFVEQSNFNPPIGTQTEQYYIRKVLMSHNALKIVIFTQRGINTLVYSNESWNLLPPSSDILQSYFPYISWGELCFSVNMSKNGMYLTLLSYAENAVLVFKFNTQINNWVLFKSIINSAFLTMNAANMYIEQTYVSSNGNVVLILDGYSRLSRFEYNLTTNNYDFIVRSDLSAHWDPGLCFVSDDLNTFLCRYRDYDWPLVETVQYFRMLKWNNGNWEIHGFPSNVIPYLPTSLDGGNTGIILAMSSDATMFIATSILNTQILFNVYYNLPLPTLHLGDMVKIKETDVSFNNANVFVKAPTVALNVSNKQYVDTGDAEIHALILASATTDTTSTTEYYDLLEERQTVQSTLAVQIENLYQYFFDQSRNGPAPSRT